MTIENHMVIYDKDDPDNYDEELDGYDEDEYYDEDLDQNEE